MAIFAALLLMLLQDDVQSHFNLALSLSQEHKDEAAIAEFRKVLQLQPELYEADLNLGILLLRNQRAAEALPLLKQAAELKPQELRPNIFYGEALLDSGDAAGAEKSFAVALQIDPKSALAEAGLGRALFSEGKLEEAAARFRATSNKEGLLQVGAAYEKAGDTGHALQIYKDLPDPSLVKGVYLKAADAAIEAKQPAKAMEILQAVLQLDPKDYDVQMNLGKMLRDDHKLLPAAQHFMAAANLRPDSAPAWNELASVLIVSEKYPEGLAALDRVRALGKEIPGDLYLRAITLDKLRLKPQALAAYRQFVDADGGAHPDQEFLSRQRMRIIENEMKKK